LPDGCRVVREGGACVRRISRQGAARGDRVDLPADRPAHQDRDRSHRAQKTGVAMPTVMITGASRGIGLEFVRQYAAAGWKVLACCRTPGTATDLNKITGDVSLFALDVDDDANIASLANQLKSAPIDVLINNAGISRSEASNLGNISSSAWLQVLR